MAVASNPAGATPALSICIQNAAEKRSGLLSQMSGMRTGAPGPITASPIPAAPRPCAGAAPESGSAGGRAVPGRRAARARAGPGRHPVRHLGDARRHLGLYRGKCRRKAPWLRATLSRAFLTGQRLDAKEQRRADRLSRSAVALAGPGSTSPAPMRRVRGPHPSAASHSNRSGTTNGGGRPAGHGGPHPATDPDRAA